MASDDVSTAAVLPGKLENHNGTVRHSDVAFVAISNNVMTTNIKDGNGGTSSSLIDHSRAGLPAAQNNCQQVQPAPSPPEVGSSAIVSESQPTSMGVTTVTSLLPNSTPGLNTNHLVLEQRGDISLNKEESIVDKSKSKKRIKNSSPDAGTDRDVHRTKEKIRWKDVWVAQLIHIRGRMHSTFTNPQRQRVDLWQIVEREMMNSCFGFDKDSEACRKKWLRVYKEYKDDLHLSNKEESQKCRFYDLVDFYVGNRSNNNICSAPFHDVLPISKEPAHVMNEVSVKPEDSGAIILHPNPDVVKTPTTKKMHASKRPRITEKPLVIEKSQSTQESAETATPTKKSSANAESSSVHTMLSELVTIGREMLQTTREYEREKLSVLHAMKDMLGRIAKKL